MDIRELLSHVDNTLLRTDMTWEECRALCDDSVKYGVACICVPPSFIKQVAGYTNGARPISACIGFPNGYNTTAVKVFETRDAVENGATEIDMVINLGWVKEKRYDLVENEIKDVRAACRGLMLKVIVETCLLTDEEKIRMCKVVSDAGADYIKTSTGFSKGGATREDVKLIHDHCPAGLRIKASGGIRTLEDAEAFLELGADRIGTSKVVELAKKQLGE